MKSFHVKNVTELPAVAADILCLAEEKKIFLFYGDMGSGKTTFIKEIGCALGVAGELSSPTYSIVNEYKSASGKIYHFDLYRLENINQCLDIGMDEYLYSGHYCFIEWPEIAKALYPENVVSIHIKTNEDKAREIIVSL